MFFFEDLKPDPYPQHSISTYTCIVTIARKVYSGNHMELLFFRNSEIPIA